MKLSSGCLGLLLLGAVGLAHAQTAKPGLWEMNTQMQSASGEASDAMAKAQKQMENMPPEQRKMVQEMMAKRGIQMGSGPGSGMTIKTCLTQDMVARNDFASHHSEAHSEGQNECTKTTGTRTGNSVQFSVVCTKPPSTAEGQITFDGPESYSVNVTTTRTVNGTPQKMTMKSTARWLGADCGTLKPLNAASK